ncbi:hypothetical protein [Streptomyces sp. NPDC059883]|uniref:hypothetical protein n=1 Tax=unclassified Streptomyces TaxID=2593676 RepID=UPI003656FD99
MDDLLGRYCPERRQIRRECRKTTSRAGRRTIGLLSPLIKLLRKHIGEQAREKKQAGELGEAKGYVLAQQVGEALRGPEPEAGEDSGADSYEGPSDLG